MGPEYRSKYRASELAEGAGFEPARRVFTTSARFRDGCLKPDSATLPCYLIAGCQFLSPRQTALTIKRTLCAVIGVSARTRTPDLPVRNRMLFPAELRKQNTGFLDEYDLPVVF